MTTEGEIQEKLIEKLLSLKYYIVRTFLNRDGLVKDFREKFQARNRVTLKESEKPCNACGPGVSGGPIGTAGLVPVSSRGGTPTVNISN